MLSSPTKEKPIPKMSTYMVVAHYQNPKPFIPKSEMDIDMVKKLEKMGFKPFQIRIMFERFKPGKLLLELENVLLSSQINHSSTPYDRLLKALTENYPVSFKNDEVTNKMKGVKNLQKYVQYLKDNNINWTYLNIYEGSSKVKIGRLSSPIFRCALF